MSPSVIEYFEIKLASIADASTISALIRRSIRALNADDYEPATIDLICTEFTPEKVEAKMSARDMFAAWSEGTIAGKP